ncbi:hypothetical protein HF086_005713 [Spodoptera exigua]|uniref:Uncharacterized protein n=1 Tax=Spodoptera exigua TaxID=7107 RepID=A0A922SQV7_SPOEX|nr:hypothetical protein HF086_005713 [Spodoptera exigua]
MAPAEGVGDHTIKDVPASLSGDEVVISGISGVFPNSDSVLDFMNNLYNKVDMVTEEPKCNVNDPDVPKHVGKITGTDKFDAQFFGVSYHLACALEPMARKLLEHAYGAIFDSGTNPQSLRGKRVGVFVGVNFTDNSTLSMYNVNKRSDFIINGCSKAMLANRISYWIDSKGPSYGLDYACSGSTACLEIAYKSIKSGECDAAIIGGCNFGLHPTLAANLRKAGLLCLDGKTKCFDKNGDGYVRADAINVIFLQKAQDAHRIYTEVYHAKGIYKMRPDAQFLPYRETEDIEKFLNEFYKETNVDPQRIEYVEAHATAIAKADENELRAIGNIFAKDNPVKVGSVKSNMGNSESASGICALTKLCLAYHQGKLPANLHYNEPQDNIPAIKDGRIQVVTDNVNFDRGFTAMNNFSFSGANFHVLLKGQYKEKNLQRYECGIPRLVLASGREETCVQKILDILKSQAIDAEEIGLLHKIFEYDIPGHTGRGYTVLDTNENKETVSVVESADYYPGLKRPLWFVYSGMGSQWAGMGADLMRIPIFANAIHKCHKVLEPLGLNLIRIVTELDNRIFDNILNAFVGIGAIQIGLTDVIKAMGIVPDYIIGHSLGEMACAYHDDTFTAEELILATYCRGKVCLETDLIKGSMAAVGVGYQAIVNQCPLEIDIACHNSHESTTISGPADKMTEFVGELTKRGIFAKEVPCANIAYHSRYIAQCGPELLKRLREVIKNPKKRSSKWISTSVPQDKLYEAGVNPRVDVLYPKIELPVSTETPLLSHFVEWEHSEDWPQLSFLEKDEVRTAMERNVVLSTHDDDFKFLEGHLRNGANVLPESAVLVLVWETLAMHIGVSYRDQPVVFRDIHFHSEIIIKPETPLRLTIAINRGSNKFEVSQNDIRIASGIVSGVKVVKYNQDPESMDNEEEEIILNSDDVYNIFKSRGYSYKDQFKSIQSSALDHKKAFVQWNGEWVTFLDSLIQLMTLSRNHDGISTPKFIRKIRISILEQQISNSVEINGAKCFPAQYDDVQGIVRCAGVELDNVTFVDKPVIDQQPEVLLTKSFYPHYNMDQVDMKTALQIMLQIIAENTTLKRIKTTQIVTSNTNIICIIKGISTLIPNVTIDVASIINVNIDFDTLLVQNSDVDKANVFIIEDLFGNKKKLDSLKNISKDSFIIALECGVPALQGSLNENFTVISSMSDGKQILILLKRRNPRDVTYVPVNCDNKLDWVSRVHVELNKTKRVMLVSERQPYCGALGFVNKLKSDGEDKIGLIAIDDCHAPTFDPKIGIYKHQLSKNLTVNIFRKVSYAGISSKDVQKAVSNTRDDLTPLGMDFSGTNADGNRVMGLVAGGSLSTTVEADSDLLWPVPEHWSLQDAATVPLPYALAYYCLTIKSRLLKGQSVFVTGGAGALGQAVIAVCLSLDCTVFTTVNCMRKKNILLQLFPGLDEKNIGYSRDDSFLSMIKMYAHNKGCDIVINCASGFIRETAMKCVGIMGFFLDLSAYDMTDNKDIGMSYLEKDRSYKAVNFSSLFRSENAAEKKMLQHMLAEGIANGTVRPISRIEYTPTQISRAFRLISSSKHIGKVLIKMSSPELVKGFDVIPSMNYNSSSVYIVVCDKSGIGIKLADRMVKRGARKIVLHSRTNISGYWHSKLAHFVVLLPPSRSASNEYSYSLLERGDTKTIWQPQKLAAFFNGMENSLKLKYNNVLTFNSNEENVLDYEMKLAKIFGVPKIEALPEDFTVNDLLLTEDNLVELQTVIRNIHNVDYPVEKIVNMTVRSLKNIGSQATEKPRNSDGLGAFFTCIDEEEEHLFTSHPIIPMVTLLNNGTETDLDPQETYLTLIPGFEGRYQIFSGLAERLKVQAVAVQLAADIEGNNIEEMAATVRKFMKTKFESKSKFYLLGYSFGVNIALEVAAILEKEGHTGVVYCLDSSPDALRIQLNSYLGEISDSELQNAILEHISQLIAGKVPEELGQYLEQINDWPTKVDACLYTLRGIRNYSKQYKGSLLDSAYRKISFAKNYEPKLKLNSDIVLIKGKPHLQSEKLSADYNLSKYTKNPVKIYHIESDHPSAPYDTRVTNIVNNLLDDNLLEEFKKKNLCDKYVIQPK